MDFGQFTWNDKGLGWTLVNLHGNIKGLGWTLVNLHGNIKDWVGHWLIYIEL